jgi:hypothetical protein
MSLLADQTMNGIPIKVTPINNTSGIEKEGAEDNTLKKFN